ncbi:MAG: hypothetical protein AB9861_12360 [Methanosarcina sp.]
MISIIINKLCTPAVSLEGILLQMTTFDAATVSFVIIYVIMTTKAKFWKLERK